MIGLHQASSTLKPLDRWHTVLIVDDDPQTLNALRRELDREPYDVVTTDRPALALEWLERKDVSLVISDQRMPEMEGDLFLEGVWSKSPGTARILLTGYPERVKDIPASRRGLIRVVTKPWDAWKLKTIIRELLHEREEKGGGVEM